MDQQISKGNVVIYQSPSGPDIQVKLEQDSVWLTQKQMSELFNTERSVITKHLRNIFDSGELEEKSNVQKMHIASSDKPVAFYNLDAIISVGYRVNSKRGTQFRTWATNVLRRHLVDGYTLNEKRLKAQQGKMKELQDTVRLLGNLALLDSVTDEARGIVQIIAEYSKALNILDDFDRQRLTTPKGTKKAKYRLTYDEARAIIEQMKVKFKDSALVGREKDKSFRGALGAIYQTFDGKDVYPTVEEKKRRTCFTLSPKTTALLTATNGLPPPCLFASCKKPASCWGKTGASVLTTTHSSRVTFTPLETR